MATLQSLVDSQCGATNPLVNLTRIYNQNHQVFYLGFLKICL